MYGMRRETGVFAKKMKAGAAVIGIIAVISTLFCCFSSGGQIMQTVLAVSCLLGMLSVVYIFWWFSEFGKGMGKA